MATFILLSDQELIEVAMCCRLGAQKKREEAAAQSSTTIGFTLESTARYRDELANMFDDARLHHPPLRGNI